MRESAMMKRTAVEAALFGACLMISASGAGLAQTASSPPSAGQGSGGPPAGAQIGGAQTPGGAGNEEANDRRAPVLQVTSLEVMRSTHGPVLDIIRARGLTSSGGWEEGELVPLTRTVAPDGILDLVLTARTPEEAADATGFDAVEAIFPLETGHPFKGVRVHSATQSLTLKSLPGYVERKPLTEDCSKCVGKHFVAKGAALPGGKSEAEVVKEEHLPPGVRVIKASDGVPSVDSDPNRMTILVGEDGRIVSVIWD